MPSIAGSPPVLEWAEALSQAQSPNRQEEEAVETQAGVGSTGSGEEDRCWNPAAWVWGLTVPSTSHDGLGQVT